MLQHLPGPGFHVCAPHLTLPARRSLLDVAPAPTPPQHQCCSVLELGPLPLCLTEHCNCSARLIQQSAKVQAAALLAQEVVAASCPSAGAGCIALPCLIVGIQLCDRRLDIIPPFTPRWTAPAATARLTNVCQPGQGAACDGAILQPQH